MFEVNVVNSLQDVMFVARVDYKYTNAFVQFTKPHLVSIKQVAPGTGNEGHNKEYQCEYRGIQIAYPAFIKLMDNIEI